MFYIGCHLSSAKGFEAMAKDALKIRANVFQFFTRNPRGGAAKPLDEQDIARFLKIAEENAFGKLLAHAPYTLNACAADEKIREFAKNTLQDDLRRMEALPGNYYNFHPGSHVKQGMEIGMDKIAELLNQILWPGQNTTVLLETMAGKGSEVGGKFEEIQKIIENTQQKQLLGVCLDTCHVYDGGYDIVGNLEAVLEEFDRVIGLDRLKAIHLNDSKNPYASHKDRHEQLGKGSLGLKAIEQIINHPALKALPFYLETPNELEGYAAEIELLRGLRKE
ncbi:deoxyribonuclease IV [Acidaminobacterium chupaoyuni]